MSKVSVIINCYNGEEFLSETLETLKKQTYNDFELVFWDNCSDDRSSEIAHTFDTRLQYYKGEEFIPLGAARNMALKKAKGEYVAFLDCDDLWDETKLQRQVAELDKDPSVGMVFTNFKRMNMLSGISDTYAYDSKAVYKKMDFEDLVGNYSFCLSSFMIRKKALEGLDHIFNNEFKYAEEFELFSRIAYNWKTVYLPEPLVTYRIHKNMNTIQLRDRIGIEYQMALDNLRKVAKNLDKEYPEVVKKIEFARDLFYVKDIIYSGNNKKVRKLMRPYINYNIRAKCFYLISFLPSWLSIFITKRFYRSRI